LKETDNEEEAHKEQDYKLAGHEDSDRLRWGDPRKILSMWRAMLAEVFGTAFLVFFGCGCVVAGVGLEGLATTSIMYFSFAFGFGAAAAVYATAHVSGGHLNPAITLGMLFTFRVSVIKAIAYIISQVIGGILGAAFVKAIFPLEWGDAVHYGVNKLGQRTFLVSPTSPLTVTISWGNAVFVELAITFFLVWIVLSTVGVPGDKKHLGRLAPLAVGFAVFVGCLVGGPITGASLNPARSFGPAVVSGYWEDHWIFWIGPIIGAILAAILYKLLEERDYKPDWANYKPFV